MKRLLQLLCWLTATVSAVSHWPTYSNNLTDVVQWDQYSFMVNGERIWLFSGEIHYWRIPVPELWVDILQKVKAAGFNTISVYTHWGYHSASNDTLDFESGAHDFTPIFDIAKDVGLYVNWRPGPYINAETTGGGFPGWLLTGAYGSTRNNDTRYTAAWTPYWERMAEIVKPHLITNGGNVLMYQIENEYGEQWLDVDARTPNETAIAYMELLENSVRAHGIDVPTFHNNPNLGSKSWSRDYDIHHVGGDTDLYTVDSYPSCWTCDLSVCAQYSTAPEFTTQDYFTNFQETAPTMPSFLGEFQGGSYNPWGGVRGGCESNSGPDWVNVFFRNNIGQKVSAMNIYMGYGGTNWGGLPFPTVATSYDYSAPIHEDRTIGDKFNEVKLFGLMVRSLAKVGLLKVDRHGNGTTSYTNNAAVFAQELRNPDTDARFYVVKHANTTLQTTETFRLHISSHGETMQVPQFAPPQRIDGRESRVVVSNVAFGGQQLAYSTAEVLAISLQDGRPTLVLWTPEGDSAEFYLRNSRLGRLMTSQGTTQVQFHRRQRGVIVSYTQKTGMSVIIFDSGLRVLLMDRATAYETWQPALNANPNVELNDNVLVKGPYLVRSAQLAGQTLALTGDFNGTTPIEVFAGGCRSVEFNGVRVQTRETEYGSVVGTLTDNGMSVQAVASSIPALTQWKVADGLPESQADYDDSGAAWVAASDMSTPNPWKPDTYPVLYADQYGFHQQNILWRGRFTGRKASGVFLNIMAGTSSGWSAWLNGVFLGSTLGDTSEDATNKTLSFPAAAKKDGENVLFIIQDHMGHDETTQVLDPRGILNATLLGAGAGNFASWRIAGNAGGERNVDPVRGPLNEGGLHAERLGWHLPGFDDAAWADGSPATGFAGAGARFYRSILPLDMPQGPDVSLAFELNAPPGSKLRAQLYVNGYMFAKFIPQIGNQIDFPVFPGILDYHGNNTIGLSVWAQTPAGGKVGVATKVLGVHSSSLDLSFDGEYLRPGWEKGRLQWA